MRKDAVALKKQQYHEQFVLNITGSNIVPIYLISILLFQINKWVGRKNLSSVNTRK